MITEHKPVDIEQIACEICLKEIPVSESQSEEASDYVAFFCGLECYAQWRDQTVTDAEKQEA